MKLAEARNAINEAARMPRLINNVLVMAFVALLFSTAVVIMLGVNYGNN